MISKLFKKKSGGKGSRFALMALVMLSVGGSFVWWVARQADRQMRNELLFQARLIRQAVDGRAFQALSGSGADIDKAEYKQLKEQLVGFRQANAKCRFLYFLGRKPVAEAGKTGGKVFFYLDSEPAGSEDYSPPGQIFGEFPEADLRVFETKSARVSGPNRDRWGLWVSAFVPITDPATGALIAVLGMDVDARTWNGDVAARTALPASLMLVLLTFLAAWMMATRPHSGSAALKPIQQRLLMPLAAALFLLAAGAGALLIKQQHDGLNRFLLKARQGVAADLTLSVEGQAQAMNALGDVLLGNAGLRAALKARDRARLLAECRTVFEALRSDYHLSRCEFFGADRACVLRVQTPEKYGDLVERFTLREAERSGKLAAGLEVGPTGSFTLRAVQPVYDGGMLIGYLELSKEIEDVLDTLNAKNGVEFAVVIRKGLINRAQWEERMRMLQRPAKWDLFSETALIYLTLPVFPAGVGRSVEALRTFGSAARETTSGGQTWGVMTVPLKDAAASDVGNLIVMLDITEAKMAQKRLRALGFGGGLALLAGLLGFLYVLLHRTDASIRLQQSQLQKSEQRLSATLRSIGDGVITTDASGRVTDLNMVAERLTGWMTAEAAGHPSGEVFRIVDALTRCTTESPIERALREGVSVELANHTVLIARDGAEHQIADSCAPIRNTDGRIMGAVLVFRDVSKEYQQRAALRASEERHRAMFEKNQSVQLLVDAETGALMDANPAACSFYGYARERLRQMDISEINMSSSEEMRRALQVIRSEKSHHFMFQHRLSDGQIRDVESYACSLDVNGKECVYSIIHDITERRRTEQELSASETRLRTITDSAQDAILVMDAAGLISFWNPAAERIFGYTRAEAVGRDLHQLIAPQRYIESFHSAFAKFRKTGQGNAINTTIELQARRKTGEEVPVELSLSSLHLEARWHAVGIVRDITERIRAKEELIETNRQLVEATARANEMAGQAQMASTAKSDFLANMSHEIRTPMNGVIGMTGLLLDTELSGEQRRYAETVRTSAESLLTLINDILDFSKIEAGKMTLESLDFDLQELVEDLTSTLALRAQEKGLELLYSVATEVPTQLRGDPGRLRQILTNLVSNAIKFTQTGEVAIRVILEAEDTETALLRFSVRDTGIGIPKDKIGLLFEKFTQADTSTTRKYGGTGLGLAICKQLVELMGGEVSIVSEEGKGSEFSVTTRLFKQKGGVKAVTPVSADLRTVRVLIVDDNATSREILTTYMSSWGMRPSQTADGPSAIQMLLRAVEAGDLFRLAVLDMQMPIMDGEMLGQAIKADARLNATRLVMLTSLGTRDNASHFQQIGFEACLTKPARHQELKRALSQALLDKSASTLRAPSIVKHPSAPDLQTLFAGNKVRILLAEDNITNQQVALGILKKLGLRADAVANGEEALKVLEALPYDLVLMDVQMPVMDGLEATRQIRSPQSAVLNHAIPVIAMTARAMQGDQEKCLAAGMNDYVSKPVTPQTLARILDKWLKAEGAGLKAERAAPGGAARPSEPQSPQTRVWDLAGMMERVMEDKDLAKAVLEGFPEDIAQRIQALQALLDAGDRAGAERQAHSINGAASIVGGEDLRAEACEIESALRAGALAVAGTRMPELIRRFNRLKEAIEFQLNAWRS